ncbi:hypothetical protein [Bradyrhizobium sp. 2S1]
MSETEPGIEEGSKPEDAAQPLTGEPAPPMRLGRHLAERVDVLRS